MAISLTYTFSAGTTISSSQVNANFSTLSTRALDKTGDTMAGDLKFTDATFDIGKTGATRPRDGFFSRNLTVGSALTSGSLVAPSLVSPSGTDITLNANGVNRDLIFQINSVEQFRLIGSTGVLSLLLGQVGFPATQNPSSGANVLDDYEEGTWTPTDGSGASLSITVTGAQYVKIGQLVFVSAYITYPGTASGSAAKLAGLPFINNSTQAGLALAWTDKAALFTIHVTASASTVEFYTTSATALTNANLTGVQIRFSGCYRTTA